MKLFSKNALKRLAGIAALAVGLWLLGSAIFEWPPLWHYAGDSLNACMNNLRQIDGMKQEWAVETKATNGAPVDPAEMQRYFRARGLHWEIPHCPSGGTYTFGRIDQDPSCSIGTNTPPAAVKERVGLFGWCWKIPPSSAGSHALLPR